MSRTLINIGEREQEFQQEDKCSTDIASDSKYLLKENNLADIPDTKKAEKILTQMLLIFLIIHMIQQNQL